MDGVESQYIEHLHLLTNEMDAAMKAIASDNPAGLAESVARQEVCVSSLAALRNAQNGTRSATEADAAIWAAEKGLLQTRQRYAALLRHSGKTLAVLSLLCDSHLGVRKEARGVRSRQQTWSCEM